MIRFGDESSSGGRTGFAWTVTLSSLISCNGLLFALTGSRSIASSVESDPSMTRPKIVYLPSSEGCFAYVMKNCGKQVRGVNAASTGRLDAQDGPATCSNPFPSWPSRRRLAS